MISRIFSRITMAVAMMVAPSVRLSAQTRTVEHDYSEFDSIVASDGFSVKLVESDDYSTKLTIDDALESYVQCYVKARTLYLSVDTRNVPKELKKAYKSKKSSDPTLLAVVYMPKLNSLKLSTDASFTSDSPFNVDQFSLSLADNSQVSGLKINAEKSASLTIGKKCSASSLSVTSPDMEISTDNNAVLSIDFNSSKVMLNNGGSAEVTMNGECDEFNVSTTANANLLLAGSAKILKVGGKGNSSNVDASAFKVNKAVVTVGGVKVSVNAEDILELDLDKGSDVVFTGDPDVQIVRIVSSSVNRK